VLAAYAEAINPADPLVGLVVGERPEPTPPNDRWTTIAVKAASLNHHDIWSLRGIGLPAERLPMTLGCDAAGVDQDGNEVIIHSIIGDDDWAGDETLDPKRTILSERHQGTLAQWLTVPKRNLLPKPPELRAGRGAADRLADRLSDAVHARPDNPGPDDPCSGIERRRRYRADRAGFPRRRSRLGYGPQRAEA
jgi:D-arabinose 1-dehydrogenase-like Zn-dependent alcohol dehydrogenase